MLSLASVEQEQSKPHQRAVLSHDGHRQLIGYIGLGLPVLLYTIAGARQTTGLEQWQLLDSISAYYYTGATTVFVGMLFALGLVLITYPGFPNDPHNWADRAAGIIGGLAALGVAFFPTEAPKSIPALSWWTPHHRVIHYVCAVVLFTSFAVFSIWLFRRSTERWRNNFYFACGITILISIVWAGVAARKKQPIFLPETTALLAFSFSWLVKGFAARTAVAAVRKMRNK
jgi:hypothetical protein